MRQVLSPRGCTHAFPHSLAFLVFHDRQVFPSRANGLTFMASENLPIRAGGERKRGGLRDRFPGLCRSRACGALWIRLIFPPYPWLSIPARSVGWTSEDLRTQPDDPHIIFPRSGAHVLPSGLFFFNFPCDDLSMVAGFRWNANSPASLPLLFSTGRWNLEFYQMT